MRATRRGLVLGGLAAAALPRSAWAAEGAAAGEARHGLSSFGELRYPKDFERFAYVNPLAPKGGRFSGQLASTIGNQSLGTFDTLNIYVLRGSGAAGMNLTFDSLMVRAFDEPDAIYGLVARAVTVSPDGLTYTFDLRPQARFRDGSRLTARDAAFSLTLMRDKGHPEIAETIRDMTEARAEGDSRLVVTFARGRARDLPLTVAQLPIFSAAYYANRDFEASSLEPPMGSGPYRVGAVDPGRSIGLDRVPDYWAAELPVCIGQNNFDSIRYEYFRDRTVAFEAFKSGAFTYREEFTSRVWATGYDFPAVAEGRVAREEVPDARPSGTQGWWINERRAPFKDPRVREAIGLCFDFEWSNKNLMYGAYRRAASFFENSDLKATGTPSPEELALLEPLRDKLPAAVFGEPFTPPVSDGSGQDRALLKRAEALLREAGCTRAGSELRLPSGEALTLEFLDDDPVFQPVTQPFIRNLALLGIRASSRMVDPSQYQARLKDFDFDLTARRYGGGVTPGDDLRDLYGSKAATTPGSNNLSGINDPAVDALLSVVAGAASRAALTTACRALDRVLRAGRHWVPMWYSDKHRLALWDVYGRPANPPKYDLGTPATWWFDAEKARRIGRE